MEPRAIAFTGHRAKVGPMRSMAAADVKIDSAVAMMLCALRKNVKSRPRAWRRIVALSAFAALWSTLCLAQTRNVFIELRSHESRSLEFTLAEGEVAAVQLHLEGGIVGVIATGPHGEKRPLWVIDLGQGATLPYPVGGRSGAGKYTVTVTSYERERLAQVTLQIPEPVQSNDRLLKMQVAEDDLANGELTRRHWPNALPGLNPEQAFERSRVEAESIAMIPLQRLALTQQARLLIFAKGQFLPARALLQKAVDLPAADDDAVQALTWKTLSSAAYDLGEFGAAIDAGERASVLYQKTGDLYWQGIVLGNLAADYSELGFQDKAVASARQALDDAKAVRDPAGVVYCLSQLAGLYTQRGELQNAFRTYSEGIRWVSAIGYAPLVEAEIQKDLGAFSVELGDWKEAKRALGLALDLAGDRETPVSLEADGAMADVLRHEKKLAFALQRSDRAIAMAHKLELKNDEASLLLKRASIRKELGHAADSLADIVEADRIGSQIGALPLRISVLLAWGDALLLGHADQAEEKYKQALEWAQQTGEREEQAEALAGLARASQIESDIGKALQLITSALQFLDQADRSLSSIDLKASYFHLHRNWYELAIDLCMKLDRSHPGAGYQERAFTYSERAHARAMLAMLRRSSYNPENRMSEEMREAYARNRQAMEAQAMKLTKASEADRDRVIGILQQLYREREGIEAQVESSDDRQHSLLMDQVADVHMVQEQVLSEYGVLVSYWVGEHTSYRWTIAAHSFTVKKLPPRADIEAQILPLVRELANRNPPLPGETAPAYLERQKERDGQLQLQVGRAGNLLLSDLPADTRHLMVVRDGCLLSLPFASMRVPAKGGSEFAIERYAIELQPSASVALYLRGHPLLGERSSIAVVADPVLSPLDPRIKAAGLAVSHANDLLSMSPRLTGSRREALQISHLAQPWQVLLRTGFDASPGQVEELPFEQLSILHFATHILSFRDHPEVSGIALSMLDKKGKTRDGVLWAHTIGRLQIPVPMVVLSGCDTYGGESAIGERIDSLSSAFFFAGVRSVVASLWDVDDSATTQLMRGFYRRLLKGVRADEALRDAQVEMIRRGPAYSPTLWAPFVIEGWPQEFSEDSPKHGKQ